MQISLPRLGSPILETIRGAFDRSVLLAVFHYRSHVIAMLEAERARIGTCAEIPEGLRHERIIGIDYAISRIATVDAETIKQRIAGRVG